MKIEEFKRLMMAVDGYRDKGISSSEMLDDVLVVLPDGEKAVPVYYYAFPDYDRAKYFCCVFCISRKRNETWEVEDIKPLRGDE